LQKHFQDWNLACAFRVESLKYLNDLNEGFEVIEHEEQKGPSLFKTDSTNIDLKLMDEQRRREAKNKKLKDEFQIILPLSFSINQDYLTESPPKTKLPEQAFNALGQQSVLINNSTYVICREPVLGSNVVSLDDSIIARTAINPGVGRARGNTQEDFTSNDLTHKPTP
jgi:hypothetical protein